MLEGQKTVAEEWAQIKLPGNKQIAIWKACSDADGKTQMICDVYTT